jgi:hypothetical protein
VLAPVELAGCHRVHPGRLPHLEPVDKGTGLR